MGVIKGDTRSLEYHARAPYAGYNENFLNDRNVISTSPVLALALESCLNALRIDSGEDIQSYLTARKAENVPKWKKGIEMN